jgi:PAS domain S-box-containing protein
MAKANRIQPPTLDEKLFRALIENAHDAVVLYDAKGTIKYASHTIKNFGGYKPADVVGKAGVEFVHDDDKANVQQHFYTLAPGSSVTFAQRLKTKKGEYRWAETTLTNQLHVKEVGGIISNFRDITERKEAEQKAHDSQQLLNTITENVNEGIFLGMIGERFLYANNAFLKLAGYTSFAELEKVRPRDMYVDDSKRLAILEVMYKQKAANDVEVEFYRKDKTTVWVRMSITLLLVPGSVAQYLGTVEDITQKREAELALRESQQLLSSISNNVQEGFFRSTAKEGLIYANDSFARIFGYKNVAEVMSINPNKLYANPKDRARLINLQKENKTISNEEVLYKRKDKTTFLGSLNSTLFHDEQGNLLMDGVIRDITELKRGQQDLQQVNENLQAIMESTEESIYALDKEFRYLAFNENHRQVMKLFYNKEIAIGGDFRMYVKGSHDESWYIKEIKKAFRGECFVKEFAISYKGYENRHIRVTYNPILDTDKRTVRGAAMFVVDITNQKKTEERAGALLNNLTAVLESTKDRIFAVDKDLKYLIFNQAHAELAVKASKRKIKPGDNILKSFTNEHFPTMGPHLKRALKGEYFTTEITLPNNTVTDVSYSPIKNSDGHVTGAAAFVRDVTQRKRNEQKIQLLNEELTNQNWKLETSEEELKLALEELSERNFELDQFMYKTSHDLRSPLSSVLGLVNLAKLDSDYERVMDYLLKIEGRVRKLDEFVRSMLSYAKVSRSEIIISQVNPEELVKNCIRDLEYLENFSKVTVQINVKKPAMLTTDVTTFRLIVANIISNAYKYYNSNTNSYLNIAIDVKPLKATITFEDNGIGIHKEYLDKIFNMFFRATEKSEGSGLGMYIVKQAVDKLKGKIKIDSEYGKGTIISLAIPNL